MKSEQILQQLYLRETQGTAILDYVELSKASIDEDAFAVWQEQKGEFISQDVSASHWIKTCTGGYVTEVIFHQDGRLQEYTLFERLKTVGSWRIESGFLAIEIHKGDNTYTFYVVKNSELNIHSAIEYKNGELHSYLKLAPIKP